MAEAKTRPNDGDVDAFLASVDDEKRREDCRTVVQILGRITGEQPKMWGGSIIGFGTYDYEYASGRTGSWPRIGCSPRKQSLTIYIMPGFDRYEEIMAKLGKYKTGKSCLYVNRLEDIDLVVLEELAVESLAYMDRKYPS
jgi:hypothetical protein